ncbi:fatty-acid amide hydrolase 2-A isoform X2 [Belonocnema kinseyi]|uniref:fatty-acid amide hydrolase 2-A isoform X2 n=1 Tax=Belonocnema kinseyi TaxID=2817044 RepID=UPI00143D8964|nr:fatty-acid amide hydrolase 2-A isoform X2 [Belonocnema kinseyi]
MKMTLVLVAVKGIIKIFLFVIACIMGPISAIRHLKKPKRCPPITNQLIFLPATEVARRIRRREITSEEVVSTYIARCREVNPILNAIVEDRFEIALMEARQIDNFLKTDKKTVEELEKNVPLLGVPVTVKESIGVEGMSHAAGVKKPKPRIAMADADVVRRTRLAGGIPLLVSNTPELCLCWETYNNVTGTTKNPYDNRRTSGGSSGGEAALLGAGASVLSLASDIGGSCRLPAMFCGVFGHKPTPGWVSVSGHYPDCTDKKWPSFFTIAPMVRYAKDLPMFLKVISQNPEVANRLDQKVDLKKLRYFYFEHDKSNGPISAIDEDMKSAIERLTRYMNTTHGSIVQKADVKDLKFAFEFASVLLAELEGVDSIFMKGTDPREWKSVTIELLKYLCFLSPHTLHAMLYGIVTQFVKKLPKSFKAKMAEQNRSVKKELEELLGDNGVLIYPTFPSAAFFPYQLAQRICNVTYMMIFNSLQFPVTQCPMGINGKGLPIGLQIAAKPNCDHLTIAVAQEIEKAFGGWQPPAIEVKVA